LTRKTESQETQGVISSGQGNLEEDPQDIKDPTLPMDVVKEVLSEAGLEEKGEPDDATLSH